MKLEINPNMDIEEALERAYNNGDISNNSLVYFDGRGANCVGTAFFLKGLSESHCWIQSRDLMEALLSPPKTVQVEKPQAGDLFFTYFSFNDGWFADDSPLACFSHIGVFLSEHVVLHKFGPLKIRLENLDDCINYCNSVHWHPCAAKVTYHRIVD
jgi:hypothetical protein